MTIKNKQKGFALVLSLVLLLAMSLMGGGLVVIASTDHQGNNSSDEYQQTFYVAEINAKIIGGINIDQNQDKAYSGINWQDISNSFLVVHRLAVRKDFWNKSIGKNLMLFTEKLTMEKGLRSVRLDTYSRNPKAMQFYKKLDYKQLGEIDLKPNKDKYHCFEKIIQ